MLSAMNAAEARLGGPERRHHDHHGHHRDERLRRERHRAVEGLDGDEAVDRALHQPAQRGAAVARRDPQGADARTLDGGGHGSRASRNARTSATYVSRAGRGGQRQVVGAAGDLDERDVGAEVRGQPLHVRHVEHRVGGHQARRARRRPGRTRRTPAAARGRRRPGRGRRAHGPGARPERTRRVPGSRPAASTPGRTTTRRRCPRAGRDRRTGRSCRRRGSGRPCRRRRSTAGEHRALEPRAAQVQPRAVEHERVDEALAAARVGPQGGDQPAHRVAQQDDLVVLGADDPDRRVDLLRVRAQVGDVVGRAAVADGPAVVAQVERVDVVPVGAEGVGELRVEEVVDETVHVEEGASAVRALTMDQSGNRVRRPAVGAQGEGAGGPAGSEHVGVVGHGVIVARWRLPGWSLELSGIDSTSAVVATSSRSLRRSCGRQVHHPVPGGPRRRHPAGVRRREPAARARAPAQRPAPAGGRRRQRAARRRRRRPHRARPGRPGHARQPAHQQRLHRRAAVRVARHVDRARGRLLRGALARRRLHLDRAPAARPRHRPVRRRRRAARPGCVPRRARGRAARRPRVRARHHPEPRGHLQGAREVRRRPHAARPRRQARPRHRPRLRDPPRRAGAVPAHQEQPRPHRRARRRQDRRRRGARPAHRRRRRPRVAARQEARRARPGRDGGRRQVPRRVRGAAQGRARRRSPGPTARSSRSSTSCTPSSAPVRAARAPWTRATCSSPCWPAASCAWSVRRRSTSTASASRRTPPSSAGSSRCSSASRRSRTPSPSCAGSRSGTRRTTR